jgi:hypothetical protein
VIVIGSNRQTVTAILPLLPAAVLLLPQLGPLKVQFHRDLALCTLIPQQVKLL